ncbi:MAG: ribulose-phosphate 3-epimerase [Anaerolineaceae bacterium]
MVKISPSIASTSFLDLADTVKRLEKAGVDSIHFDIEDGSFVKEMRLGLKIIQDLRAITTLPFDVHLMMVDPEWVIPVLARIGIELLSVHYEATEYPRRILGIIHDAGMKAGLAFNPKTEVPDLSIYFPYLYFVNILTTEPEVKDCAYLPYVLEKVICIKKNENMKNLICEVDGGFTPENVHDAIAVGADIVVSGRGVFLNGDLEKNIRMLKSAY